MQIIAKKTLTFLRTSGAGAIEEHLQVTVKPDIQTVPDWVRTSDTFKAGSKDGSVFEIGKQALASNHKMPPTIDEVVASGRTPAEAAEIVEAEMAKYEAGAYPYPARAPKVTPTIETLMAAGLTREQAEAFLNPPPPAPQTDPPAAPAVPKATRSRKQSDPVDQSAPPAPQTDPSAEESKA